MSFVQLKKINKAYKKVEESRDSINDKEEMKRMQIGINDGIIKLWSAVWELNIRLKKLEENHVK